MTRMIESRARFLALAFCIAHGAHAGNPASQYHVVWDSPSRDHHGSMPLGNGDIGLNVWVEPSGQLVFYIGKTDSWGDNARLKKIGRVRVTLDPAPPIEPFRQELALSEGAINIRYGDGTKLRVWVDAHHPVIHVNSDKPATAAIELWRTERYTLPGVEVSDVLRDDPRKRPTIIEPDTILTGQTNRIGWYHHNTKSVGPEDHARIQGTTGFHREDPLLHRTFGALITAPEAQRIDDTRLRSPSGNFAIYVHTEHPSTPEQWLAAVGKLACEPDFAAHKKWWNDFWNRSWIRATTNPAAITAPQNQHPLRVGVDQCGQNKFKGEIRNTRLPDQMDGNFAIEAEVNAPAGATGRIFDKITPGGSDGFLLDMLPGDTLRLIVGSRNITAGNALPHGEWAKVALTVDAADWRVSVNGKTLLTLDTDDAAHLSRMFALQRFITACAGRGAFPIKFNGSLFVVPHAGKPGGADYRRWGPGYWWQNTRLPYLSMCANGDFDMLEPLWRMYVDRHLPFNQFRTRKYFGFENAAYYPECVMFWGDVFLQTYGWTPVEQRECPLQESGWHKWEWVAGPELVWMMIEHYDHTRDKALLAGRIIPTATAVMRFFNLHYKTNEAGQLVMYPSMACETWWDCTNPMPEVAGLRAICEKLLALPEELTPPDDRAFWKTFVAKLPPLPTRDTPSGPALAPAERFANKRNSENPELYAVFPFRLCAFEKDNQKLGLNALKHRWDRGHFGWRQDDIFMAYLGLTDDAREGIMSRARNADKSQRFPAFWGPNYDWTPDQDHGGVLMKAYQAMLMQTDGEKIFLLPAWPKDWDVEFKLHAPGNTIVEGIYRNGEIERLNVLPEAGRARVVVCP